MAKTTKQGLSKGLMEALKTQSIEQGIDVRDTHFKLSVEDKVGEDYTTSATYVGFEPVIFGAMTAALMLDDAKAEVFLDVMDKMGDPEDHIDFDKLDEVDVSFNLELKIGQDYSAEFTMDNLSVEGLSCALQSLYEEGSDERVMTFVSALMGTKHKYEEGLILTGDREPSMGDLIRRIAEGLAEDTLEEESK